MEEYACDLKEKRCILKKLKIFIKEKAQVSVAEVIKLFLMLMILLLMHTILHK